MRHFVKVPTTEIEPSEQTDAEDGSSYSIETTKLILSVLKIPLKCTKNAQRHRQLSCHGRRIVHKPNL
jgi:hypothetical protein